MSEEKTERGLPVPALTGEETSGVHEPGVQFGAKYELLGRIAVGGMAEIYLARAKGAAGFQKKVVLKQVLPHLCSDENFIDMFLQEAKLGAQLSHSNIVQIFDFGHVDDTYFIAMEYVEGRALHNLVVQARRAGIDLPLSVMVKIISFACEGLQAAHVATDQDGALLRLVHRDISPSNILVSYNGAVKLTDFGIAKAVASSEQKTRAGVIKGKYSYMSPQQALGQPIDHRADLFALGVVLYEVTTLHRLFRRSNDVQTIQALLQSEIPPPSAVVPGYPPALEEIVMRCLERDPDARYQDARTLHRDLERFLNESGQSCSAADIAELMGELYPTEARTLVPPPVDLDDALLELSASPSRNPSYSASYLQARPSGLSTRDLLMVLAVMLVGSGMLWGIVFWAMGD